MAIRQRIEDYERENSKGSRRTSNADSVIRHFSNEMTKQQQLIQKSKSVKSRLTFITEAFKQLLSEGHFVALLHIEGMHTMPRWLAKRFQEAS